MYIIDKNDLLQENVNKKHVKVDEDKNIFFKTKEEIQSYNSKHSTNNQNPKNNSQEIKYVIFVSNIERHFYILA